MKVRTLIIAVVCLVLVAVAGYYGKRRFYDPTHRLAVAKEEVQKLTASAALRDGDIIFQTSLSAQSQAIQLATHSPLSHCGIIFRGDSGFYVEEAVQPVKRTPLANWIARGKDEAYTIKRLRNSTEIMTPATIQKLIDRCRQFEGHSYDIYFGWGDDRIYCSELIWKVYKRATGLSVGALQQLKDFDLTNDVVIQKLRERCGNAIPLDDTVISPVSIYNSDLLVTVK